MKIKLFYHGLDLDGNSSRVVIHFIYDTDKEIDESPEDYHTIDSSLTKFITDKEYLKYDEVFIVDININLETAKLIQDVMGNPFNKCVFRYIDHHDKFMNELNAYDWATVKVVDGFGIKISATKLLYTMFSPYISGVYRDELTKFVNLVSLYDTYDWKLMKIQEAQDLHILMSLYGKDNFVNQVIQKILNTPSNSDPYNFSDTDKILLSMEKNRIKLYMDEKMEQVKIYNIFDQSIGIVFVEARQYCSELGQLICNQLNCDIALMIDIAKREVSLRSVKNDFHLGKWVNEFFGGGGHPKAAGYQINNDLYEFIIHQILFEPKNSFMPITELQELGLLYEVNRTFFHPLGLALTIITGENTDYLVGIRDDRNDPEGIIFGRFDLDKISKAQQFISERHAMRKSTLGYIIQDR